LRASSTNARLLAPSRAFVRANVARSVTRNSLRRFSRPLRAAAPRAPRASRTEGASRASASSLRGGESGTSESGSSEYLTISLITASIALKIRTRAGNAQLRLLTEQFWIPRAANAEKGPLNEVRV